MSDRKFFAFVDEGRVGVAFKSDADEEVTEQYFEDADGIEKWANENADLPADVKASLLTYQRELSAAAAEVKAPVVGPQEAKYAIAARHTELENMIVAGAKPSAEHFASMAKQDAADFAKLDAQGRKAVHEDMAKAAGMSKDYAEGIKDVGLAQDDKELTLSGEDLDQVRKRLAENFASPYEHENEDKDNINKLLLRRTGNELMSAAFIKPIAIARDYEEVGLEYRLKNNNLSFRVSEAGNSLHTTSPDKKIVSDMVAMAKAKNWSSIKLTGSQEFRREAWLQAESQGIKTTGYTARAEDKEIIEELRKQRRENSISNVETREKTAPRTPANASESVWLNAARLNAAAHLLALSERPGYEGRDVEVLTKLAEMRSMFVEDMKQDGLDADAQAVKLAQFDQHFENPRNLEALLKDTQVVQDHKLPERKGQDQEQSR